MKTKMTLLLMIFFCSLSTWANEKSSIKEEMNEKLLISSHEAPEPTVDLLTQPIQLAQLTAHKVEFLNLGNAKNKPKIQYIAHGETVKRPSPNPSNQGLDFKGWKKVISGNNLESDYYKFNTPVTGPLKLWAMWENKEHYITFKNEFGNPQLTQTKVLDGKKVTKPKDPIAYGKKFQYWYWTNENIPYDFNNPVEKSMILTAKWETLPVYTVKFRSKDGTELPPDQEVPQGYKAKEPEQKPKWEGYDFNYWTLNGVKFDFNTAITKDIELIPSWTASDKHSVTFDTKGGEPRPIKQRVTNGKKATKPTTSPKKDGYDFIHWAHNGKEFDFNTAITERTELVAIWKKSPPTKHTVTFDTNGGTPIPDKRIVNHGEKVSMPSPNPKDPGDLLNIFKEWQKDGKKYDFDTPVTSSFTLKAKYEKTTLTIVMKVSFDANGGEPTPKTQIVEKGKLATEPTTSPKKDGYKFTGWNKDGVYYDFDTPVKNNFTLTATWELITANINISADKEVHYYPNPVKNNLYLTCEEGIKEIHLFNVNGQCLRHLTPNEQTNVTVEMGTLNAGFYLIKVTTPKGITTLKVIKQ